MGIKGCMSITKYFLFVFNLLFFILGGVLLCFGLWILFDRSSFASMLGSTTPTLKIWCYVFSGVGILTMLLGFLGCLGSLKEIKCLLGFYFAFLLLLFAAQITIGVLVYTQRNNIKTSAGKYVEDLIKSYGLYSNQTDIEESWDFAQEKMKCCGWNAPEDWLQNPKISSNSSVSLYPCSCRNITRDRSYAFSNTSIESSDSRSHFCQASSKDNWPVYHTGCMNRIQTWLQNNIITVVGVCIGISLLEFLQFVCQVLVLVLERKLNRSSSDDILFFPLFVMTLSMCLCRNLDQNYNKLARYS